MVNRDNFLKVRAYLSLLADQGQLAADSVGRYKAYLRHLLLWAGECPLREANKITPTFPAYLASLESDTTRMRLRRATVRKEIQIARRFFGWLLAGDSREFGEFPKSYIGTLVVPRHLQRPRERAYVSLEEAIALAQVAVPDGDYGLCRDRAASALLFLSGMRAGALVTLPICCLDLERRLVTQSPDMGVHTKNRKSAETYLLDIPELMETVRDWDSFVRTRLPRDAPWYAPMICELGVQRLAARVPGSHRGIALAKRLRRVFALAGLAYKSPHKFRHGHAVYGLQHARTMADYKAVSMNLMHNDIRVTDGIYAVLAKDEVQRRIAGLTSGNHEEVGQSSPRETDLTTRDARDLTRLLAALVARLASSSGGVRRQELRAIGSREQRMIAAPSSGSRASGNGSKLTSNNAAKSRKREMEGTRTIETKRTTTTNCRAGRMPARPGKGRKEVVQRARGQATNRK